VVLRGAGRRRTTPYFDSQTLVALRFVNPTQLVTMVKESR
jgi:hypothetical protein